MQLTDRLDAVSYTHLDVYKRQQLPLRPTEARTLPPSNASCVRSRPLPKPASTRRARNSPLPRPHSHAFPSEPDLIMV